MARITYVLVVIPTYWGRMSSCFPPSSSQSQLVTPLCCARAAFLQNLPSASGLKPRGRQARPPRASNTLSPAVADETLGKRPLPFTDATNAFQRRALENIMDPTGPPEHIAITPALPAAAGHSGLVDDPSFLQMAPAASLQGSYEQDDQDEIEEGPVGMAVDSSQREEMVPPAAAPPAPLHIQDPQGKSLKFSTFPWLAHFMYKALLSNNPTSSLFLPQMQGSSSK